MILEPVGVHASACYTDRHQVFGKSQGLKLSDLMGWNISPGDFLKPGALNRDLFMEYKHVIFHERPQRGHLQAPCSARHQVCEEFRGLNPKT
jgi:hypothetical protein